MLVWDAGWGDSAADECRALPRVFGQVSGERGRHFQRGHQKNSGLQSQTQELQEAEEMCGSVRSKAQEEAWGLHFTVITSVFFVFFKRTTLSHWEWLDVQRPKMLAVRADAGAAWFGDAGRGDAVPKSLHPIESSSKVTRANDITGKTILQAAAVQLEIPSVNIYFIHIWEMLPLVFLYI